MCIYIYIYMICIEKQYGVVELGKSRAKSIFAPDLHPSIRSGPSRQNGAQIASAPDVPRTCFSALHRLRSLGVLEFD